ncbi:MAG: DUF2330 domain-containing protein [Sandaracinaceae bacterium]|nr:DUF2330 domain-containing protein [Sandaracinaceae bacterium]
MVRALSAAALLGGSLTSAHARAICRVVESEEAPPVAFDATTNAFFVVLDDVIIDYRCPEDDEALSLSDWGRRQLGDMLDHEVPSSHLPPFEALGLTPITSTGVDAGAPDAGVARVCRHGEPATEVHSPIVSLVIQPRLLGGGGHAGLVMPVAARPDVALGPSDAFSQLAAVGDSLSERVHETVLVTEDASLGFQCTDPHYTSEAEGPSSEEVLATIAAAPLALYGCGSSDSAYYRPGTGSRGTHQIDYGDAGTVSYETIPVSEAYSVTALSASSLEALVLWMDANGFAHDEVDDEAFSAYVGAGRWFVALDVHPPEDLATTELGVTGLSPLVVSWPGDEVPIQNRLQFDPEGGTVLTDAYVLAAGRVDAEDGSALTLAAGTADLVGSLASFGLTRGTLTHLRLARQQHETLEDSRIVPISAVAPAPTHTVELTTRVRIPLACCEGGGVASSAAPPRTFTYERTYPRAMGTPEIPEAWFRSPEHPSSASFCAVSRSSYGSGLFCAAASTPVTGFGPIAFALWLLAWRGRRRRAA